MKFFVYAAICLSIVTYWEAPLEAQLASNEALFQKLESEQTTGEAFERFLKLGKKRLDVREYLATHLPDRIAAGPENRAKVWDYEVNLAGLLRINETIPSLTRHIDQSVPRDFSTLSGQENLADYPAGRALGEIGDAAIPALSSVLQTGDYQKRWVASHALNMIQAPAATDALSNHLPHESDARLRGYLERVLQLRRAGPSH